MPTKVQELRKQIADLVEELNKEFRHPEFVPLFPNVLVYVLPREQRIGNLWTPDNAKHQNKVTHEGVVLRLWESPKVFDKWEVNHNINEFVHTQLEIGDHVLFPHYAGAPVSKESKDDFRIIKEDFPGIVTGDITAKLEYSKVEVTHQLSDRISKISLKPRPSGITTLAEAQSLMKDFIIYPRASKTLSGV